MRATRVSSDRPRGTRRRRRGRERARTRAAVVIEASADKDPAHPLQRARRARVGSWRGRSARRLSCETPMPFFRHEGSRLAYTIYGDGPRTFVLVHGLLLSQKMHRPLARALAERGNRVVTLDLLGHGRSDRPRDMTRYSMPFFGQQMIALLDHLEVEEAVLGGTSLGANATLEAAVHAPDRVRGMIVEMPVLDNALLACAIAFTPLM